MAKKIEAEIESRAHTTLRLLICVLASLLAYHMWIERNLNLWHLTFNRAYAASDIIHNYGTFTNYKDWGVLLDGKTFSVESCGKPNSACTLTSDNTTSVWPTSNHYWDGRAWRDASGNLASTPLPVAARSIYQMVASE